MAEAIPRIKPDFFLERKAKKIRINTNIPGGKKRAFMVL
jgi:hypothetical protein